MLAAAIPVIAGRKSRIESFAGEEGVQLNRACRPCLGSLLHSSTSITIFRAIPSPPNLIWSKLHSHPHHILLPLCPQPLAPPALLLFCRPHQLLPPSVRTPVLFSSLPLSAYRCAHCVHTLHPYLRLPLPSSCTGANCTYTIEAMMGDRKALQAGTSHNLGTNFAKVRRGGGDRIGGRGGCVGMFLPPFWPRHGGKMTRGVYGGMVGMDQRQLLPILKIRFGRT